MSRNRTGGDALARLRLDEGLVEKDWVARTEPSRRGRSPRASASIAAPSAAAIAERLPDDHLRFHAPQVKALAARENGDRTLRISVVAKMKVACGGALPAVLSRAFERWGSHVHFVDDVDLEAGLDRRVADPVEQFAHVLDLGPAGRVQLQDIEWRPSTMARQ